MIFSNPAGLWLLLGIPVLIIIYLIRSRHEDRPVSSTYIWKLSDRFKKKRIPIQKIRKFLLFLLQLALITIIALMAAKPTFPEGQTYDYILVLDSSASMEIKDDSAKSRFERAKAEILDLVGDLRAGHTVTVILAGDEASYLTRQTDSAGELKLALKGVQSSNGSCNISSAIELAQEMCDRTENGKVFFYTDKDFTASGNIEVVDMRAGEWNVSLEGLRSRNRSDHTEFTGLLTSYNKDAVVTVGLKIDGKTVAVDTVECQSGVQQSIVFKTEEPIVFERAEIYVELKDNFDKDNSYGLCKMGNKKYNVLLVSPSPFYLRSALDSLGNCNISACAGLDGVELSGYDLYIFDSVTPEIYPTDASVIVFGSAGLPAGVSTGVFYNIKNTLTTDTKSENEILKDIEFSGTVVNGFYPLVTNATWQRLMFCRGNAVCVTTEKDDGTKVTVFSFDLHNSNLPLQASFMTLMRNLVEYSVPTMLGKTEYTAGDTLEISVLREYNELYAEYPDATIKSISYTGDIAYLTLRDTGMYTILAKGEGDAAEYVDFYVAFPEGEFSDENGGSIAVTLPENTKKEDAMADGWFWFALALLAILLIEWGVYYYEQY